MLGKKVGRYQIIEQLAEGGMAFVYKAYDSHLETFVALKVIRSDWLTNEGSARMLARFEAEAKRVARLSHPNIIPILDYGKLDDVPYLVMKYIPGGTLNDRLRTRYHWREAARLLLPIARALSYAHQQGLVHRDVKPANILLNETGEPMLSDFGLVKLIYAEKDIDETGSGASLLGTPEYMAPEQALGKTIDARADIYSLGLVFYEMITGHRAFTGPSAMEIASKQINEPVVNPRVHVPDLPEFVEKLLLRMLEKDPADRYPEMSALCNVFERIAGSEDLSTPATIYIGPGDARKNESEGAYPRETLETAAPPTEGRALPLLRWLRQPPVFLAIGGLALIALIMLSLRLFGNAGLNPQPTTQITTQPTATLPVFIAPTRAVSTTPTEQPTAVVTGTTEAVNVRATQLAASIANRTATASVQGTAAAEDMFTLLQRLQEDGAITSTDGIYHPVDDFNESSAEVGSYQYRSTRYRPADFVIRARTDWQTASQSTIWDATGCGFVFREVDANNHYLIYLGLDGNVYLKAYLDGVFYSLNRAFIGVNGAIKGNADVVLAVQGSTISYYVNDQLAMRIDSAALTEGELNLTLISGNSTDFGTRCTMRDIDLWTLDPP